MSYGELMSGGTNVLDSFSGNRVSLQRNISLTDTTKKHHQNHPPLTDLCDRKHLFSSSTLLWVFPKTCPLVNFAALLEKWLSASSNYAVAHFAWWEFSSHLIIVSPQNVRHPGHSSFATFAIQILGGGGVCKTAPWGTTDTLAGPPWVPQ